MSVHRGDEPEAILRQRGVQTARCLCRLHSARHDGLSVQPHSRRSLDRRRDLTDHAVLFDDLHIVHRPIVRDTVLVDHDLARQLARILLGHIAVLALGLRLAECHGDQAQITHLPKNLHHALWIDPRLDARLLQRAGKHRAAHLLAACIGRKGKAPCHELILRHVDMADRVERSLSVLALPCAAKLLDPLLRVLLKLRGKADSLKLQLLSCQMKHLCLFLVQQPHTRRRQLTVAELLPKLQQRAMHLKVLRFRQLRRGLLLRDGGRGRRVRFPRSIRFAPRSRAFLRDQVLDQLSYLPFFRHVLSLQTRCSPNRLTACIAPLSAKPKKSVPEGGYSAALWHAKRKIYQF